MFTGLGSLGLAVVVVRIVVVMLVFVLAVTLVGRVADVALVKGGVSLAALIASVLVSAPLVGATNAFLVVGEAVPRWNPGEGVVLLGLSTKGLLRPVVGSDQKSLSFKVSADC